MRYLIDRNQYLETRGILQTTGQVLLKLDEVHVLLTIEQEPSSLRFSRGKVSLFEDDETPVGQLPERDRTRFDPEPKTVELPETLRDHPLIVFLGDPGSGKSTLTRFLALHFATAFLELPEGSRVIDREGNDYGPVQLPIRIRISEFAEALSKEPSLALRTYLPMAFGDTGVAMKTLSAIFEDAFKRGQAILFLDGLDEITDGATRAKVAHRIDSFISGVSRENRIVVTSRKEGYGFAALGSLFTQCTLRDFQRPQIEQFLTRWCHAVVRSLRASASQAEVERYAKNKRDDILRAVDKTPGVLRLAANPLMLTILALVHRNGAELPRRRVDLYELAVKTLAQTWRPAQGIDQRHTITEAECTRILGPLAYWIHENRSTGLVKEAELFRKFSDYLGEWRNADPNSEIIEKAVTDFIRRVREHTGLLVERAPGEYGFMHLTFQEYFAALELVQRHEKAAERIYKWRHHERWREPILLGFAYMSGKYSPEDACHLIHTAILAEGEEANRNGFKPSAYEDVLHRDLFFTVEIIRDCAETAPRFRQEVVTRFLKLYFNIVRERNFDFLQSRMEWLLCSTSNSDVGVAALSILVECLESDRSAAVRGRVAFFLGEVNVSEAAVRAAPKKVGEAAVRGALVKALREDGDEYVRRCAALALGQVGVGKPEAIGELVTALREDRYENVRICAAEALGQAGVGDSAARGALMTALLEDESDSVRWRVALALGKAGMSDALARAGLLTALREDRHWWVRMVAVEALGETWGGDAETRCALVNVLRKDGKSDVRSSAAEALGKAVAEDADVRGELVKALREDGDDSVRGKAADALWNAGAGDTEGRGALQTALLEDGSAYARARAALALAPAGVEEADARGSLVKALREDGDYYVRSCAAEALGPAVAGDAEARGALVKALREDGDKFVRGYAALALGPAVAGDAEARGALVKTLREDGDKDVRASAAFALGQMGLGGAEVRGVLVKALREDGDKDVRASAAFALGQMGMGDTEVRAELVKVLGEDGSEDVRVRAAEALGQVGMGGAEARGMLVKALGEDESSAVRASAALTLAKSLATEKIFDDKVCQIIIQVLNLASSDKRLSQPIKNLRFNNLPDALWYALWLAVSS